MKKSAAPVPDDSGTAAALLRAARELFSRHGFDGTSVRAISARAGTNLGAITYHFGSKQELYEAVVSEGVAPSQGQLAAAAAQAGPPLQRVAGVVRAFFDYLHENPDLPSLLLQLLSSSRPIPPAALQTMQANVGLLTSLIAEGQSDGSIRVDDPRLMALSIGAQPIWLVLARRAIQEGAEIDQDDPHTRARVVDSVVDFVRAGLERHSENAE
jgi:AcrR family transcriptional regulator